MNERPIQERDRGSIRQFICQYWGSDKMVSRGKIHMTAEQSGFLIEKENQIIGVITFLQVGDELEVTLLDSRNREQGIGTKLVDCVKAKARELGCRRVWLITTNDNIRAIQFFQKRGFDLIRLHHNSMEISRKLKPTIPATGYAAIPIRHELEFEYRLD